MTFFKKFTRKSDPKPPAFQETPQPEPRWAAIFDGTATCPCCNARLLDLLSLAYAGPEAWIGTKPPEDNDVFFNAKGDVLTHDFCRIGDQHFVRAVMLLPFHGMDSCLILGIWVHLEKPCFDRFHDSYPDGKQGGLDMQFGWVANVIPGFSGPHPCCIQPRDNFQRPIVHAALEEDPLYGVQIDGMTYDMLMEMLEGFGHSGIAQQIG